LALIMLTKDLIEIICNDRQSKRTDSVQISSLIAAGGLLVVSLYMLNALQFSRLRELILQTYFQYLLCCLLLLYIFSARMLVSLSKPGKYSSASLLGVIVSLLLLGAPTFLTDFSGPSVITAPAVSKSFGKTHTFLLVALALPWLALLIRHLRFMAPTRLALTGLFAGMVSYALAAMLLLLGEPKNLVNFQPQSAGFALFWVSLIGALAGTRFLRW
jgi:hypothetical protein